MGLLISIVFRRQRIKGYVSGSDPRPIEDGKKFFTLNTTDVKIKT